MWSIGRFLLIGAVVLLFAVIAYGDIVKLKHGDVIEGKVVNESEEMVKLETGYGTLTIPREDIAEIVKGEPRSKEYKEKCVELAENHYQLALWCKDKGLKETMNKHLEEAIALNPNHKGARELLGYYKEGDKWIKGEKPEKEKKITQQEWQQMHAEAINALQQKELEKAEKLYKKIIKIVPSDNIAYYNLACTYSLMNKKREAVEALIGAIDKGYDGFVHMEEDSDLDNIHNEPGYRKIIGVRRIDEWKLKEAVKILENLEQETPDDNEVPYHLARICSYKHEKEKALVYLKKAVEADFSNIEKVENDAMFDNIRNEPAYKELVESLKAKSEKKE